MIDVENADEPPPRCIAAAGSELLDFGPIPDLVRALR